MILEKMLNKEKSNFIVELLGKQADWESQSKRFLSCGKPEGFTSLLVSSRSMSGVDKIPALDKYENALKGGMDLNKKIMKLGEDLNFSINTNSSFGKVASGLVRNAKNADFPKGN